MMRRKVLSHVKNDLNQIHNHVDLEYQVTGPDDGISKLGQMFYEIEDETYIDEEDKLPTLEEEVEDDTDVAEVEEL